MIGSMPISRGARWPIGKNCTNSMSTSAAPARSAQRIAVAAHVGRGAVARGRAASARRWRRWSPWPRSTTGAPLPTMPAPPRRRPRRRCRTRSTTQRSPARRMPAVLWTTRAQRLRHRRAGVEEIDIDAARPVVARRDAPAAMWPSLRAQPTPHASISRMQSGPSSHSSRDSGSSHSPRPAVSVSSIMMAPVVGRLGAERDRDRHLRHHGRAAAADQAAVDQQHAAAGARRLDRGVHAGRAGADHQHIGFDLHRLGHPAVMRRT